MSKPNLSEMLPEAIPAVTVHKLLVLFFASLFVNVIVVSNCLAGNRVQPFVLSYSGAGEIATVVTQTREKLSAAGFRVVGSYVPYDNTEVLAFTSDELGSAASQSERGGYGAVMRASVSANGPNIELVYTNPEYWASAYRLSGNLSEVKQKLKAALGAEKEFGSGDKELTAKDMSGYHYTFMMEYFDDPSDLNQFDSHAKAVAVIEENLAAGKGAAAKVYRVDLGKDIKGKQMTLFGVALKGADADDCSSDRYIMSRIDKSTPGHAAHLPYEILVYGNKAEALYGRFRIALSWPHLPMMASETGATFMSIMCAPGAIEEALSKVAGVIAKTEEEEF